MATKANNEVSVDALQKALEDNPDLLRAALNKMGVADKGRPAYTILGTEMKEVVTCRVEGTRIVRDAPKKLKHYNIRLMNGSTVSIPEHCLANYKIDPKHIPMVDEDGLTEADRRMAIEQGAC